MDLKITLLKAVKTAAAVVLGSLAAGFLSTAFADQLSVLADALASAVPVVGAFVGPIIKTLLVSGVAGLAIALENVRKQLLS